MKNSILTLCLGAASIGAIITPHAATAAALPAPIGLISATPADLVSTPAGAHGFVRVDPQTQRLVFEDGTPATFYTVNYATFLNDPKRVIPTEEMVEVLTGMKALGVNAIRCQVADNRMQQGVFGQGINEVALENRDRFIAEGKKLGIYFHMCLSLASAGKGGATELFRKAGGSREMMIIIDDFIDYQRTFTTNLLNHVNPYTGLAYKDEPAIISLQLGNEQHAYSRHHWQNWTRHTGPYAAEIKTRWNTFLANKYTDRAGIAKAWGSALLDGEDPVKGTVAINDVVFPTWKDKFIPNQRQQDIILFADAMQRRFHDIMRKTIREEVGDTKHLISDNGWIRGDRLIRQTAHEKLDLLDLQHYWPHGERGRQTAEKLMNVSPIRDCGVNIIASMLTAREFDGVKKPAFITEYNSHKDNLRLPQFVPVHTVLAMLTGIDGVALWAYGSHKADDFFNQDHWFGFNRDTSDLERELTPFVVGSYLWRTSIPELIDSDRI
ncbi:MAG: beta-galactosidase, partial [Verrucomicrobiota bacterium]